MVAIRSTLVREVPLSPIAPWLAGPKAEKILRLEPGMDVSTVSEWF